jgi:raffinose/stachyose/melibiose transport system substrate-binding protein
MFLGANVSVAALNKGTVKFDWLLLPPVEGSTTTVQMPSYQGDSWGIPKNSKNVAAAKKFVEFLVSNDMQVKAFGNTGVFPIVNTVPISELKGVDPITLELIADSNKNGAPTGWTSAVPGPDGQLVIGTSMQSVWSGQMTVQQAAQAQQDALTKARAGN